MAANITVKNTDKVARQLQAYSLDVAKATMQQINRVTVKATNDVKSKFRKTIKHRDKSTGQLAAGIIPKFATNPAATPLVAEVRGLSPVTTFNEMGTGKRGLSTAKDRLKGYRHGRSGGMEAKNAFYDARKVAIKELEKGVAKAVNKENPTKTVSTDNPAWSPTAS